MTILYFTRNANCYKSGFAEINGKLGELTLIRNDGDINRQMLGTCLNLRSLPTTSQDEMSCLESASPVGVVKRFFKLT